jgi:predicted hotdog family 3-hydroxylacyl-ACP dehydratase
MTCASTYPPIEALLPHRGKMLLVDEIVQINKDSAVSRATPTDHWPMSNGSTVPSLLLIELVAQTSGLSNGLECLNIEGHGTRVSGWLVGIKKAKLHAHTIALGEAIVTEVKNSFKFEEFREIEGICKIGENVVVEAVLQVVRT